MITRRATATVESRLREYPAVALIGPRQCGKTTLARSLKGSYFDLEQDTDRLRLDLEWNQRLAGKELIILDEAQTWPEVFPRLRGAIDEDRKRNGRFLLLGSVSPALMVNVSESLAGRLSLVELTPLLLSELKKAVEVGRHWLCGGYPDGGVLRPGGYPDWQSDYLTLLTQRDLPAWGLSARPQTTIRLLRMLAAVHGQVWNASRIGQSLGLSYQTVNSYLDYLIGAFLIRRLPSWQANIKKRLVKSPKVFWRDTGLLHSVLNASNRENLLSQPWVGASWEGYVIEQVLGALTSRGARFEAFHFQTSDQHELDLVLDLEGRILAFEIKLTSQPSPADMDRLNRTAKMVGATRCFLVSKTSRVVEDERRVSCDLPWLMRHLHGT